MREWWHCSAVTSIASVYLYDSLLDERQENILDIMSTVGTWEPEAAYLLGFVESVHFIEEQDSSSVKLTCQHQSMCRAVTKAPSGQCQHTFRFFSYRAYIRDPRVCGTQLLEDRVCAFRQQSR